MKVNLEDLMHNSIYKFLFDMRKSFGIGRTEEVNEFEKTLLKESWRLFILSLIHFTLHRICPYRRNDSRNDSLELVRTQN